MEFQDAPHREVAPGITELGGGGGGVDEHHNHNDGQMKSHENYNKKNSENNGLPNRGGGIFKHVLKL
jgi:hypothetical protein